MLEKRMKVCIVTGAILGVVCILGGWVRSGFEQETFYLLAFWYNRLLMGVVIGLTGEELELPRLIIRGAILGLLVSLAFYSATNFHDPVGFLAGIFYGIIIEYVAFQTRQLAGG